MSAAPALRHIRMLARQGVGYVTLADAAGVSSITIYRLKAGKVARIHALTERKILEVTREAIADGAVVSSAAIRRMIEILVRDGGLNCNELTRRLGFDVAALLKGRRRIKVKTVGRVERFFRMRFPARPVAGALLRRAA